jgi:preprotein translocase subunit YajC
MFSVLLASSDDGGGGGFAAVAQLAFFGLIFVAMYFLLIRPQRKRQRESAALQSQLAEGDEVMLTSGLYGFVDGIEGDTVWVEIADNVTIRVTRGAIAKRTIPVGTPAVAAEEPSDQPVTDTDDK